ncbi:LytR/AlgR family response regulator transcription factor [Thomasclavelia sp.]
MRIAIIDDILECRNHIYSCLQHFFKKHYTREYLCIEKFTCGEDFLSVFQKSSYDLIFIDQYMQSLSGIDTAKQIREVDKLVTLVFITTSRDHAIDSYKVRASGYLLKPFSYEDFEQTMILQDITRLRNARFICLQDEKILLREILWCDVDGHYIHIHTQQRGDLRYRTPFVTVSNMLLKYPQFLTCYKGCIVNLDHVERLDKLVFILTTGDKILFSKRDKKKIEDSYHTYLFQKTREEELL